MRGSVREGCFSCILFQRVPEASKCFWSSQTSYVSKDMWSCSVFLLSVTLLPRELSCGAKVGVGTVQVDDLEELLGIW